MLKVNFTTKESIEASFESIAAKFSNDFQLQINNTFYRIVDMEFYAWSENFKDPYTYQHDLQKQRGKLYLHSSGIDITFGDELNYCGMLIRSVVKLYGRTGREHGFMGEQITGPHGVATELLSNINGLEVGKSNTIQLVDVDGHNQDASFYPAKCLIKTKRVRLTKKKDDQNDEYLNMKLRYVALLQEFPKFKQCIPGIEALLGEQVLEGNLSIDEAQEIIGYKKFF